MISYYPSVLWPYLHLFRTAPVPNGLQQYFFQSWEDAFWHLLDCGFIKNGVVLVPDFYCMDVVDNLHSHGLIPVFYPLDDCLQVKKSNFASLLKTYKPSAVIIFHAAGITSALEQDNGWRTHLPMHCVVIHDNVHRIVEPITLKLFSPHDIILDSLRKVTPLSGSRLFVSRDISDRIPAPRIPHPVYALLSRLDYLLFRTELTLGTLLKNQRLIRHAHKHTLARHDDRIGDSMSGNSGPFLSKLLSHHLNHSKIANIKRLQSKEYSDQLHSLPLHLPAASKQYSLLHAFPVVASIDGARLLEPALDQLNVWCKFPDSPWSRHHRVFFLPLGPHITIQDQTLITRTIRQALSR